MKTTISTETSPLLGSQSTQPHDAQGDPHAGATGSSMRPNRVTNECRCSMRAYDLALAATATTAGAGMIVGAVASALTGEGTCDPFTGHASGGHDPLGCSLAEGFLYGGAALLVGGGIRLYHLLRGTRGENTSGADRSNDPERGGVSQE